MSQSREYLSSIEEDSPKKQNLGESDSKSTADIAIEPAHAEVSNEVAQNTAQGQREVIRPKLRKRQVGVSLTESKSRQQGSGVKAPRSLGPFPENEKVKKLRKQRAAKRALEVIKHSKEREEAKATQEVPAVATIDFATSNQDRVEEVSLPPMELSIPPIELDPVEPTGIPLDEWNLDPEALDILESVNQELLLPPEDINQPKDNDESDSTQQGLSSLSTSSQTNTAESFFQNLYAETASAVSTPRNTLEPSEFAPEAYQDQAHHTEENTTLKRGMILWENQSQHKQSTQLDSSSNAFTGWSLQQLLNRVSGAETWLAQQVDQNGELEQKASLKVVWPHLLNNNPMMWQFDAEIQVRALQELDHPCIPKVWGWGESEAHKAWFAATEWVEGQSLAQYLRRSTLSLVEALEIFLPLVEALIVSHQQGLIHRKIQPSHIILSSTGPKLISFQWVDEIGGEEVQRGQQSAYQLFGQRPKYLAPEWMQNALITDATDVYALAACLLEAVVPQAQTWHEAPANIQAALAAALHPHPNERSTANDFLKDLKLSTREYRYQANHGQEERLALHEIVARIRTNELGWHLIAKENHLSNEHSFVPWGEFSEIVEAVERSKRYQVERSAEPSLIPAAHPDFDLEALESRERQLKEQQRKLKEREEELNWREDAIKAQEKELTIRNVSLQDEDKRLDQLKLSLDARLEGIKRREQELKDLSQDLHTRAIKLSEKEAEIQSQSTILNDYQDELKQQEKERAEALALLETEIEAERIRLQEEERQEQQDYETQVRAEAQRLIAEREEALKAAEQAKLQAEQAQKQAEEEAKSIREAYEEDLAERESVRLEQIGQEGAFARASLRTKTKSQPLPPEGTHQEFDLDGMVLRARFCPAGSTWCGSDHDGAKAEERPRHRMKIDQAFWFMETPITQAQWEVIMEGNPSTVKGSDLPVEGITWIEAVLYCNALSQAFGLEEAYEIDGDPSLAKHRLKIHWRYQANGFRLPSEAEWEYAARSGLSGQRHSFAMGEDLNEVGWFAQNAQGRSHPVGIKLANRWGLYDLCGNVWEWCHDEWRKDAYRQRIENAQTRPVAYNPQLTPRVIKGGAWYDYPSTCRIANRPGQAVDQAYGIGLRPCLPYSQA